MANSYDNFYGFSILDDIHNLFPELLYETDISNNSLIDYLRFRMSIIFQGHFLRAQTLYRNGSRSEIYRRHLSEFRAFQSHLTSTIQHINPSTSTQRRIFRSPRTNPTSFRIPRRTSQSTNSLHSEDLEITLSGEELFSRLFTNSQPTNFFQDFFSGGLFGQIRGSLFDPVTVHPTQAQIALGSTLINDNDVPSDIECSICSGREHPNQTISGQSLTHWRKLNCDHFFHKECIDRWLNQSVRCPNCRADIRQNRSITDISGNTMS